jgi:hypothetical protein
LRTHRDAIPEPLDAFGSIFLALQRRGVGAISNREQAYHDRKEFLDETEHLKAHRSNMQRALQTDAAAIFGNSFVIS